jgi:hypothetical protein
MAFAYLAIMLPIFALEFMGDSYGSECRSEKRRNETHIRAGNEVVSIS